MMESRLAGWPGGRHFTFALGLDCIHSLQDRPLEFVQEPGDVIFIPSGWWHMVLNLEVTVSVTQNFVDCSNLDNVCRELEQEAEPELLRQFLDRLLAFKCPAAATTESGSGHHRAVACGHDPAVSAPLSANTPGVANLKQTLLPGAVYSQPSAVVAPADRISRYARRVRQRARRLSIPRWSGFRTCTEFVVRLFCVDRDCLPVWKTAFRWKLELRPLRLTSPVPAGALRRVLLKIPAVVCRRAAVDRRSARSVRTAWTASSAPKPSCFIRRTWN